MLFWKSNRWIKGPDFLWHNEDSWPKNVLCVGEIPSNDPEVRKRYNVADIAEKEDCEMNRLITRCADWNKLKKSVAWLLQFKLWLQWKLRKKMEETELVKLFEACKMTVKEMDMAEHEIIKFVQMESFGEDVRLIKTKGIVSQSSSIRMFGPILVEDLLCVDGLLKNVPVEVSVTKNPMILPKHHHVVALIVRHYHDISGHSGQKYVLSLVRQIEVLAYQRKNDSAKSIKNCFKCKRLWKSSSEQKIADLPEDRVTPGKPPFSYVGVDYFGPFMVERS